MKGIRLMKNLTIAAFAGIVVFAASCTTVERTATTTPVQASVKQYPTVADLDVKPEKVKRTENWNFSLFNIGRPSLAQRKKNLVADMVEGAKADVLVEPQYSYTKKLFGPRSLTISGYPATFKNFRPATDRDLKALAQVDPSCERHAVAKTKGDTVIKVVRKTHRVVPKTPKSRIPSRIGLVAGLNLSNFSEGDWDNRAGFHVGIRGEFGFSSSFYGTASLIFSEKGAKYEEYGDEYEANPGYLEIPVMFGYRYSLNNGLGFFAETGPYFACGISGKSKWNDSSTHFFGHHSAEVFDAGWGINVGVEYSKFQLHVGYESGFSKLYKWDSAKNNNCMVGVAYMF